ncbi:MAG: hypothetical protein V1777_01360 [Candidatus Micrarchaeota archaeon]
MVLDTIPNQLGQTTADSAVQAGRQALAFVGDPAILIFGIVLVIAAVLILYFLKQFLVNSILGVVAWVILNFVFNIHLPFWLSLIVGVIFGLAGIGVLLVLRFLGIL